MIEKWIPFVKTSSTGSWSLVHDALPQPAYLDKLSHLFIHWCQLVDKVWDPRIIILQLFHLLILNPAENGLLLFVKNISAILKCQLCNHLSEVCVFSTYICCQKGNHQFNHNLKRYPQTCFRFV